ncbi:MAG: succinate dehydrogenase assembly factor 2 [Granulosicoccaceae bacterium]|jgi:antitoxin CptB
MTLEQDKVAAQYDLARLRWQCRRGMLELDYLLEDFLDRQFGALGNNDKALFVELLKCSDTELQAWLIEKQPVNDVRLRNMVARIREVRGKA